MSLKSLAVLFSSTAMILLAFSAAAIEPEEAADALVAALAKGSDSEATYESAEADGGDVVIGGLTVSRGADEPTLSFAETTIEAPTDSDNGVFDSPSISFSDGTISGKSTGALASATLTGVTVLDPATMKGDALGESILFETAEGIGLRATREAEPGEITVARIYVETSNVVDNMAQDSSGLVEDLVLPPEVFVDATVKPETLGYDKIVVDISWDGSRDVAAGTMTLDDLTLSIEGGGDLSITGVLGKLPNPRALNDAGATDAASKVEVHRIAIRYDDDSLAGRVLDYMAAQQGISRDDYANQMAAALPFLLAVLNNPAFQNQVAEALSAFLKDPQSLSINIEPEQPVSGAEIMGLAGTAPQTIPDRLKASVEANSPE